MSNDNKKEAKGRGRGISTVATTIGKTKEKGKTKVKSKGNGKGNGKGKSIPRAKVYFNFDVVSDTERWLKANAKYGNREESPATTATTTTGRQIITES